MIMKNRRWLRVFVISIILVACIFGGSFRTVALARTEDGRLNELQNQIKNAQSKREELANSVTNLKNLKASLQQSKDDLDAYVSQLDASLVGIQQNIAGLDILIESTQKHIEETEKDLEAAIAVQDEQYEAMKERIRFMFECGDKMALGMLTESATFGDMLNKAQYIEKIAEYDRNKLNEYMNVVAEVESTKQLLEEEKATLDEAIKAQEAEQANVEGIINEKAAEIYGISENISEQEREIAAAQATMADMDRQIAALEEEARKIQYGKDYDGGIFTWPAPTCRIVTGEFNEGRTGYNHKGVDLAKAGGAAGQPVVAAYHGVVTACANDGGWNGGMGNYVMIDHGSGLKTIYMHCSAVYVSKGQNVSAGDSIGAVGNTGWSYGAHLHFQVMQNGVAVSPWNYLGR